MTGPISKLRTVVWRGVRRRCPHCGKGAVFNGWVKVRERCPACDLLYLQDQGDLCAYLMAIDRALFILPLIVMIYFRLYIPDSIWFFTLAAVLLGGFIYTLPHRNGICLGLDYLIRRNWGDLSKEAQETDDSK